MLSICLSVYPGSARCFPCQDSAGLLGANKPGVFVSGRERSSSRVQGQRVSCWRQTSASPSRPAPRGEARRFAILSLLIDEPPTETSRETPTRRGGRSAARRRLEFARVGLRMPPASTNECVGTPSGFRRLGAVSPLGPCLTIISCADKNVWDFLKFFFLVCFPGWRRQPSGDDDARWPSLSWVAHLEGD